MKVELSDVFDRVVVVNLAKRPERMERFWQRLGDWPFKKPQRFEAVDGSAIPLPPQWERGAGAWGCLLSHCAVVQSAIDGHVSSLLILEDDAFPVEGFSKLVADFLARVPRDWECLMLGAEHLRPPTLIGRGIVQCVGANRTHAYAIRGRMMGVLLDFWKSTQNDHCDIVLASLMGHFKTYAPDPFLIGQDSGYSDVTGRGERLRFLSTLDKEAIAAKDLRYRLERLVTRVAGFREPFSPPQPNTIMEAAAKSS